MPFDAFDGLTGFLCLSSHARAPENKLGERVNASNPSRPGDGFPNIAAMREKATRRFSRGIVNFRRPLPSRRGFRAMNRNDADTFRGEEAKETRSADDRSPFRGRVPHRGKK